MPPSPQQGSSRNESGENELKHRRPRSPTPPRPVDHYFVYDEPIRLPQPRQEPMDPAELVSILRSTEQNDREERKNLRVSFDELQIRCHELNAGARRLDAMRFAATHEREVELLAKYGAGRLLMMHLWNVPLWLKIESIGSVFILFFMGTYKFFCESFCSLFKGLVPSNSEDADSDAEN